MRAITYIGNSKEYTAKVGKKKYIFEWQKSLGIGNRDDEVNKEDAETMAQWRTPNGKRLFILE